jgi:hypothetical protein
MIGPSPPAANALWAPICSDNRFEMCQEAASYERYNFRRSRYCSIRTSIIRIISIVFLFVLQKWVTWLPESSSVAVRIRQPRDFCHCGATRCSPGGVNVRPGFIFTAKGPNSSIEKNASSGQSQERVERMRSSFSAYSGSLDVSTTRALRSAMAPLKQPRSYDPIACGLPAIGVLSLPSKTYAASGGNCAITVARWRASCAAVSCAEASPRPTHAKSVNTPHRQRPLITMALRRVRPKRARPDSPDDGHRGRCSAAAPPTSYHGKFKRNFRLLWQVATGLNALSRVWWKIEVHEPIFFRSAQRFFIANDILLLPSRVRALPCFPFTCITRGIATFVFLAAPDEFAPSSAAMARPSLSLSCLSSVTISSVFTFVPSYRQVIFAPVFPPSPSELIFLLSSRSRTLTIASRKGRSF